MDKLEQKEFEDILELVIGKEGSLDRIRAMSTDAMAYLKNLEKETAERCLSERVAELQNTVGRIRRERDEARAARDDAVDRETEALAERDAMRNRAENAERGKSVLSNKLKEHQSSIGELKEEAQLLDEENLKLGKKNTGLEDLLAKSRASLEQSGKSLSETMTRLKEVLETNARLDGLLAEQEEMVGEMERKDHQKDAEPPRPCSEKQDALQANEEAKEAVVASRREHDRRIKQLQEEAHKALDDQAALHSEQVQEMRTVADDALMENQVLSNVKMGMHLDLVDKSITIASLRREADEERRMKESAQKDVDNWTAELDRQRQQGESAIAERDQRIEEMQRQKEDRELELERANPELEKVNEELERVKEELTTKSLALTEMECQQKSVSSANKAIQEGLARVFSAQSGCQQPEIGRWLTFVQMAGQAEFVSCSDQLTAQGRTWTILQQWDSQTVALPAAATSTIEELLVRLYGKVGEGARDDEAVDLIRRLVVSAETIGQVPFSLARYVVGECLGLLVEESLDYHAVAIAFGLRQLVNIISRCSQDVGEFEERLGGMLPDQSTPLGALWVLLGSDNGLALKARACEGQEVSLPDGSVVPARYCPVQDIVVLVLPRSKGFVWALELGTNGVRRVEVVRIAVEDNYEWRLKAVEGGEDIILPSEDWGWYCEMICGNA
ncbi:hypothetical protein F5B21DRAFT_496198 [Xylaria acuta]|nr:hypothetical protein F5B21DRAFT_496198 [Xylaria acuta]